ASWWRDHGGCHRRRRISLRENSRHSRSQFSSWRREVWRSAGHDHAGGTDQSLGNRRTRCDARHGAQVVDGQSAELKRALWTSAFSSGRAMKRRANHFWGAQGHEVLFALAVLIVSSGAQANGGTMTRLEEKEFGKLADGTPVRLFTLSTANGMVARVTSYGAILTELRVPDRNGKIGNVVHGFDNLKQYAGGHPFFGA